MKRKRGNPGTRRGRYGGKASSPENTIWTDADVALEQKLFACSTLESEVARREAARSFVIASRQERSLDQKPLRTGDEDRALTAAQNQKRKWLEVLGVDKHKEAEIEEL